MPFDAQHDQLLKENAKLKEENEELKTKNDQLQTRVNELEKDNFTLMERNSALENRNEALTEECQKLKDENDFLRQKLEQKEQAGNEAATTQRKKEKPMSLISQLNALQDENEQLKAELAAAKLKLATAPKATTTPAEPAVTKANALEQYNKIEGAREREAFRKKYARELGLTR